MKVKFVSRKKMEKMKHAFDLTKDMSLPVFLIRLLSAVKLRPNFLEIIISLIAFLLVKINIIGSENANTVNETM
jgi:hypothetical protein